MEEYPIKRGHYKFIKNNKLKELMEEIFGNIEIEEDKLVSNFGAMKPIRVWVKNQSTLCVEINTLKNVDLDTARESIKARNLFLEKATGFTSKERVKRLKQVSMQTLE